MPKTKRSSKKSPRRLAKSSSNGAVRPGRKMTPYYLGVLDSLETMVKKGKKKNWSPEFKPQKGMTLARQREIIQKLIYTREPFGLTPKKVRVRQTDNNTVCVEWR